MNRLFIDHLRDGLSPSIEVKEVGQHINDPAFADQAAQAMIEML